MALNTKQHENRGITVYGDATRMTRACEICGKVVLQDYAYSYSIAYMTTGHAYVSAFTCPTVQHWGCTPDHALEAAIQCAREHLHPELMAAHARMEAEGRNRHSDEDTSLYQQYGERFHELPENIKVLPIP